MPPCLSNGKLWTALLIAALASILASAIVWMRDHPFALSWDEAEYFNVILKDQKTRLENGRKALAWDLCHEDVVRPPAYRILAIPAYSLFGLTPLTVRLTSLAYHWLGLLFVYLTVRRLASPSCAVLSVLILLLSPDILFASILFYTEYPLFLATTAMFYFVVAGMQETPCRTRDWLGLGAALGLGLLAKVNFVLVAFPLVGILVLARWSRGLMGPPLGFLIKAGGLACLLALPWWGINLVEAMDYARYSRNFSAGSLGPPSLETYLAWAYSVVMSLLGPGSALVIAAILLQAARKWRDVRLEAVKGERGTDCQSVLQPMERGTDCQSVLQPMERTVVLACVCSALPLVFLQLSGTNHLLRHITPSLVPLAILIGLLAHKSGWNAAPILNTVCGLAFLTQLVLLVLPVWCPDPSDRDSGLMNGRYPWRVMMRLDQWDWTPLRRLADQYGFDEPVISYVGGERNLNPAHMRYIWMLDGKVRTQVHWLWRHEDGAIDWDKVMAQAAKSDLVLTAPDLVGDPYDNAHNKEFAQKLSEDRRFHGPIRLWMRDQEPVEVDVFVKKRP